MIKKALKAIVMLVGVTGVFLPRINWAEDPKNTELKEIVVTATRTEKAAADAPGSVSIVTQKEIEKRNVQVADEALNALAGVLDRRATGLLDPIANIQMRGFPGSQRTLMLLDGLTLNDPYSGGQKTLLGVAPETIERIEVVRGPFSSLYGGHAMGGVVNVITKIPEKREINVKAGYGSSLHAGESLENLRRFYVSYGDRFFDKLSTFIGYGYRATDGYPTDMNVASSEPPSGVTGWSPTTTSQGKKRYLIGDKGDRSWWDDSVRVKAKYDFTRTTNLSISFMRSRNEYEFEDPHTYLRDSSGEEIWSYSGVKESSFLAGLYGWEGSNSSIKFETKFSDLQMQISMGLLDWEKSWNTVPGSTATLSGGPGTVSDCPLRAYNSEVQFTLPVLTWNVLTFGGNFRHSSVENETLNLTDWRDEDTTTNITYQAKGKEKGFALFLQDEIMILENLTAYIGARQDWWETYDGYANDVGKESYPKSYDSRTASYFSPKASLVYNPFQQTILKGSIGKAFRPPTVYELYRTYTGSYGTVYASNPDLKPETTTSWEVGLEQKLWQGAKAGVTYFDNHIDDLIYSTSVTSGYYGKENAGSATSKGVEVEVEQKFDNWLKLFSNFTYTDAIITENSAKPATVGKQLTDVPEIMFNAGAYFETGPFSGSVIGRYVGKRYSNDENLDTTNYVFGSYDPFFVVDLKVSYALPEYATLSLSVDNVLNEQYYYYRKAPGTAWYFEVSMEF